MIRILFVLTLSLLTSVNGFCDEPQQKYKPNPNRILTCMNTGKKMTEYHLSILKRGEIKSVEVRGDSLFLWLSLEGVKRIEKSSQPPKKAKISNP